MELRYTIIHVRDVPATVAFYETAFGLTRRFIHESQLYAEMETGATTLTFAGEDAAEVNGLDVTTNRLEHTSAGWEICLVTDEVDEAFARAVECGAHPVVTPAYKPWGQTVSYVRDLNGCLVSIASAVVRPGLR